MITETAVDTAPGPTAPDHNLRWRAVVAHVNRRTMDGVLLQHDGTTPIESISGTFPRPLWLDPTAPDGTPAPLKPAGLVTRAWVAVIGGGGLGLHAEGTVRADSTVGRHLARGPLTVRADLSSLDPGNAVRLVAGPGPLTSIHVMNWRLSSVVAYGPAHAAGALRMWLVQDPAALEPDQEPAA